MSDFINPEPRVKPDSGFMLAAVIVDLRIPVSKRRIYEEVI
jgi:hypothetical protein